LPYPIPGTPLFERISNELVLAEWEEPKNLQLVKHKLLFDSKISEVRLKFAIVKAMTQFYIRKHAGEKVYWIIGIPLEKITNFVYKKML
jgi:hypothetical protein